MYFAMFFFVWKIAIRLKRHWDITYEKFIKYNIFIGDIKSMSWYGILWNRKVRNIPLPMLTGSFNVIASHYQPLSVIAVSSKRKRLLP